MLKTTAVAHLPQGAHGKLRPDVPGGQGATGTSLPFLPPLGPGKGHQWGRKWREGAQWRRAVIVQCISFQGQLGHHELKVLLLLCTTLKLVRKTTA
jgi:hypothetical protein